MSSELQGPRSKAKVKVVATGGFAKLIAGKIDAISEIDENLTLEGLRLLVGSPPVSKGLGK
jgi:pantothenate kinase type III